MTLKYWAWTLDMHWFYSCNDLICRRRAGASSPKSTAESISASKALQSSNSSPAIVKIERSLEAQAFKQAIIKNAGTRLTILTVINSS
jgi:hypothetical protein